MDEIQYLENKFRDIKDVGNSILQKRLVMTSVAGGILFYILANTSTFNVVEKLINDFMKGVGVKKFKIGAGQQTAFHSVVFSVLFLLFLKWIFNPLLNMIKNQTLDDTIRKKNGVEGMRNRR